MQTWLLAKGSVDNHVRGSGIIRPCGAGGHNQICSIHLKEAPLVCFSEQRTLHALIITTLVPKVCAITLTGWKCNKPFYPNFILLYSRGMLIIRYSWWGHYSFCLGYLLNDSNVMKCLPTASWYAPLLWHFDYIFWDEGCVVWYTQLLEKKSLPSMKMSLISSKALTKPAYLFDASECKRVCLLFMSEWLLMHKHEIGHVWITSGSLKHHRVWCQPVTSFD